MSKELLKEELMKRWSPLLEDSENFDPISDRYRKNVTAVLLENQKQSLSESTAPGSVTGNVEKWDPILMSLVRRAAPNLMAYDVCGVQPMSGPTGLIFALRATYGRNGGSVSDAITNEALFDEARTGFGGTGGAGTDAIGGSDWSITTGDGFTQGVSIGRGMPTAFGENLGADGAGNGVFQEMSFNIDRTSVTAKTRALKAEYSMELSQDLKAIHGLDAESELANMLSNEILAEINREVIRTLYTVAKRGSQRGTAAPGIFDLDTDSNGRWSVERFKGLLYNIERDCNTIAKDTRRGKGNFIITSSDVASALSMIGVLDTNTALNGNLNVDDTGNTFVGTINNRLRVYVDPYFSLTATNDYYLAGYKGSSPMDAGLFYCPYIPLQMVSAVGEDTFQPKIGFKTRYGLVSNPFVTGSGGNPDEQNLEFNRNQYYRFSIVRNVM